MVDSARDLFFFQAEDGIRDLTVTGVQTCALPILLHANRVEGLAAGAGLVVRGGGERRELRARASYGFADHRAKGALSAVDRRGRGALEGSVYREGRDGGDAAVIAPLLNSFASQEFGHDYRDHHLAGGGGRPHPPRLWRRRRGAGAPPARGVRRP